MHIYYTKKRANPGSGRSRRGYRRSPGRTTDYRQQPANPPRTTAPTPSSSRIIHGTDYSPARIKEPITSPPLTRNVMQNTDPALPRMVSGQRRIPREPYSVDTQKLTAYPLPIRRQVPAENDDPSLFGHLKRLGVEIQGLFKEMPPGPRFVCIAILACLSFILHLLLQAFASWINLIYLITGIVASIIVIVEYLKKKS